MDRSFAKMGADRAFWFSLNLPAEVLAKEHLAAVRFLPKMKELALLPRESGGDYRVSSSLPSFGDQMRAPDNLWFEMYRPAYSRHTLPLVKNRFRLASPDLPTDHQSICMFHNPSRRRPAWENGLQL